MSEETQQRLRNFLAAADKGSVRSWSDLQRWHDEVLGLLRSVLPLDHDRVDLFARHPTHSTYRRDVGYLAERNPTEEQELKSKLDRLSNILRGILTELDARRASEPQLAPTGLHPWIAAAVVDLWNDGHHRQAVDEATRVIEIRLKAKLGREDLGGVPLVTAAFNPEPPKPGNPRLRFRSYTDRSRAWTNAHQGAMHFAQGCMMRIRNLLEHHAEEPSEQVALESLGALSLLARWVDEAVVVEHSPSRG
ncbi:MAG TPA: hypothetical protein ENH15_00115 [Actinobacteria bacterium]|nr:hypothetical protein [Actinomycetota bacterium]